MFKKIILASAIFAAASSSLAFAATGPYVGASAGVINEKLILKNKLAGDPNDFNRNGAIGNLFAGYGMLINQHLYLGAEAFGGLTNTKQTIHNNIYNNAIPATATVIYSTVKNTYLYGASLIPGVMLTDQTMVYARVGVVRSRFEVQNTTGSSKQTLTGAQAGVGVQTSLTQNIDVRGEYNFAAYQSHNFGVAKLQPRTNALTVGLAYKFD